MHLLDGSVAAQKGQAVTGANAILSKGTVASGQSKGPASVLDTTVVGMARTPSGAANGLPPRFRCG